MRESSYLKKESFSVPFVGDSYPWLGDFTDAGIEVVHFFDIGESSLPVFAYLLNGSGAEEELNRSHVVMLAAEPQFGVLRLHLAAAGGTWDPDNLHMRLL